MCNASNGRSVYKGIDAATTHRDDDGNQCVRDKKKLELTLKRLRPGEGA